jgi:tetratricopeptide (TPR) repeat protein
MDQETAIEPKEPVRAEEFARRAATLPPEEVESFKKALHLLRSGRGVLGLTQGPEGMLLDSLGVYEALLTRSWAVRYDDPREMCHLANVAREMSEGFDPATFGEKRVADLQARAWGELANAYRVANRYQNASDAFGMAFIIRQRGSGDRLLLRRLLDLEASLLGCQREFEIALQRLTILAEQYREDGDGHMAGRTLVTKALYTYYNCQPEKALLTLREAMALIDEIRDPDLLVVASFDELLFLVDCGRCPEARRTLFKKRAWLGQGGRIARVKLRGIEGRIAYGMGELESAEMILRDARDGLAEAELGFSCSLAGLDLAMTLMRLGRRADAIEEGLKSADMFLALSIHRELLGTVAFLQENLRDGKADVEGLETTTRFLRRRLMELGWK